MKMMNVNYVDQSNINTITGNTKTKGMGKDDFLKMLLAQLKNQDPLKPVDGTDFASQLAQFTSIEQLTNMSTQLASLASSQAAMTNTSAIDLIGKQVTAGGGNTVNVSGDTAPITYNLEKNAKQVTVNIYDANGSLIDSLEFNNQSQGVNTITWNCKDLPKGDYKFDVTATDTSGNDINTQGIISGIVTDVKFKNNVIYLTVGGQEIPLSSVLSVKKSATS
jgi:flagellar basal-body rod modification protein FlgD